MLQDKTVVITGATSGIGKVTAIELAKMGAGVIFNTRDTQRGKATKKEIQQKSGNDQIYVLPCDLGSLKQVESFAYQVLNQFDQVDILINNAGVLMPSFTTTQDGYEASFAVNHLAHFLLTRLLLHKLVSRPDARIINVSSNVHKGSQIDFDDVESRNSYSMMGAYGKSKLANVLFTRSLAEKLRNTAVTVNALHPGVINTRITRNANFLLKFFFWTITRSAKKGAKTSIYLATSPEVKSVSGQYFVNKRIQKPGKSAYDTTAAKNLWEVSEQMIDKALSSSEWHEKVYL